MNKTTFERLSRIRVQEAKALLEAGQYAGAYYLLGYAVECALKACICRQVHAFDFPDKDLANKAYSHDLEKLVEVAGLTRVFNEDRSAEPELNVNWTTVKDWSEVSRYDDTVTESRARSLHDACMGANGILRWVEAKW